MFSLSVGPVYIRDSLDAFWALNNVRYSKRNKTNPDEVQLESDGRNTK